MASWLDERVGEARSLTTCSDYGSLLMMFFQDRHGAPVMATTVDDAMAHLDEVMLRNLAWVLGELPAEAALLFIPRSDGRPRPVDRRLWPELKRRVHGTIELLDLVVVGPAGYWSARAEPTMSPPRVTAHTAPGSRAGEDDVDLTERLGNGPRRTIAGPEADQRARLERHGRAVVKRDLA